DVILHGSRRRRFELVSAVHRCDAQAHYGFRNRVIVELPKFIRQFQPPLADGAGALEGQVSLIMKVKLEYAVFIFQRAYGDRRNRYIDRGESRIGLVGPFWIIAFAIDYRIGPELVFEQAQRTVQTGMRSDDAGNPQADGLDAAHVMAGIVHV